MSAKRTVVRVVTWIVVVNLAFLILYLLYGLFIDDDPFNLMPPD